jgi:lysophospholipase L1-like esterase
MILQLRRYRRVVDTSLFAATLLACGSAYAAPVEAPMRFACETAKKSDGAKPLSGATMFAPAPVTAAGPAYGFDLKMAPTSEPGQACTSDKPFFFSVAVPDGNYRVEVVLGGKGASETTVRAESRRLMVPLEAVKAGASKTEVFNVNVRTPQIKPRPGAETTSEDKAAMGDVPVREVKLKPREIGALDWDAKLTLEINGDHPAVRSITVTPVTNVPTLYLAGDSTVVDQDKEPWAAWGQMLPAFFGAGISVANHAESGETIRSFIEERRLPKILSVIKPGDFLMVQFAHNDQKPGNGFVSETEYRAALKRYIGEARDRGATPILVTSMNRRAFDAQGHIQQTLGVYPEATRQVAQEEKVGLIDLNAMSKTLYEAMGPEGTLHAFVHYPANTFPNQPEELKDDTHFNAYGAYELARCVVQSMMTQHLPVAKFLRTGITVFDPAHPDALANWRWPASPLISTDTPYGR